MSREPQIPISFLQRLQNIYISWRKPFRKPRPKTAWPDFSQAPVEIFTSVETYTHPDGSQTPKGERQVVLFPDAFPEEMMKRGWFNSLEHCMIYGDLTFLHRYPNHPYSYDVVKTFGKVSASELKRLLTSRDAFDAWADENKDKRFQKSVQ